MRPKPTNPPYRDHELLRPYQHDGSPGVFRFREDLATPTQELQTFKILCSTRGQIHEGSRFHKQGGRVVRVQLHMRVAF